MNRIAIGVPEVRKTELHLPLSAEGFPQRFLTGDMVIDYDRRVEDVPESLLVLPAVGNLLPLAWASDSELHVPDIDERFDESLDTLRNAFNRLYPDLRSERVLVPDEVSPSDSTGSDAMLLFSGGVDSLASYIRHRETSPILVSVHGADVSVRNRKGWEQVSRSLSEFAAREGSELATVETNFRSMLEYPLINSYYRESITGNWWGGVQHGLALLTHCAPVAHRMGVATVYIAATHTEEFSPAWGSCPQIDNAVEWNGTRALHDGYELSRQDKIREIAHFVDETDDLLTIRSCFESDSGNNCSRCEKCCRTIVGLELAGLDPTNHGYHVADGTFEDIREALKNGVWDIGKDEEYMWWDLQRNLPPDDLPHERGRAFFDWFQRQDVAEFRRKSNDSSGIVRTAEPYLKHVPDSGYQILKYGKRRFIG